MRFDICSISWLPEERELWSLKLDTERFGSRQQSALTDTANLMNQYARRSPRELHMSWERNAKCQHFPTKLFGDRELISLSGGSSIFPALLRNASSEISTDRDLISCDLQRRTGTMDIKPVQDPCWNEYKSNYHSQEWK